MFDTNNEALTPDVINRRFDAMTDLIKECTGTIRGLNETITVHNDGLRIQNEFSRTALPVVESVARMCASFESVVEKAAALENRTLDSKIAAMDVIDEEIAEGDRDPVTRFKVDRNEEPVKDWAATS